STTGSPPMSSPAFGDQWVSPRNGAHLAELRGGTMAIVFPGESADYRAARNQLLEQEIGLRRAMEEVASCRRITCSRPGGQAAAQPGCGCRSCSRPARTRW